MIFPLASPSVLGFIILLVSSSPTSRIIPTIHAAASSPYDGAGGSGDTCDNNAQCENGGVCAQPNEHHPHRYCHCATGFAGIRCHTYCPLNCLNGGYCRYHEMSEPRPFQQDRNPNDYVCQCFGLFQGSHCEISYINCGNGKRCYNGGICQRSSNGTQQETFCNCPQGYGGESCQIQQQQDNVDDAAAAAKPSSETLESATASSSTTTTSMKNTPPPSNERNTIKNFFGIVFGLVLPLALFSWYFVTYYEAKRGNNNREAVEYSAVEVVESTGLERDDAQSAGERQASISIQSAPQSWRNTGIV